MNIIIKLQVLDNNNYVAQSVNNNKIRKYLYIKEVDITHVYSIS